MADQQNPEQGNSQPSGGEGEKLFFGKYKSLEEAEAGYKELERGFHAKSQEASQWKEIADSKPAHNEDYGQSYRSSYVPYQAPQTQVDPATEELTKLYSNPRDWKRSLIEEAKAEVLREQRGQSELAKRVQDWRQRNPDLVEHEDLLTVYVNQTDGRLKPESRLDLAAVEVRKRLAALRGPGQTSNLDPALSDMAPGSSREGAPQPQRASQPAPTSQESELAAHVAARNAKRLKIPGSHR